MQDAKPPISVKNAFEALKSFGFPRAYVERLLPDWWDSSLFKTSTGALQFAALLQQRLGLDVHFDANGELVIRDGVSAARFKRRSDTREDELHVAASLGVAAARLALHCTPAAVTPLPDNPKRLAQFVLSHSGKPFVEFAGLVEACWQLGIPVLFLKALPKDSKRATGMAIRWEGRYAVVLGFNSSQAAKQLFVLAHELGHICLGHLSEAGMLIDEDINAISEKLKGARGVKSDSDEIQADKFALALLRNGVSSPLAKLEDTNSAAQLASSAVKASKALGIDPGHLILSYAREHHDWMMANQALGYFPASSALETLKDKFMSYSLLERMTDANRDHLLHVQGY